VKGENKPKFVVARYEAISRLTYFILEVYKDKNEIALGKDARNGKLGI